MGVLAPPGTPLIRRADWPERLADVIAAAESRPYMLGQWDCLRFACACIEAMTGTDFWPRFAGSYSNKREALKTIILVARDLPAAITRTLAVSPAPTFYAQRGDLVLYRDDAGEHIGVCLGGSVAVLGPSGLETRGLMAPGLGPSWRIG